TVTVMLPTRLSLCLLSPEPLKLLALSRLPLSTGVPWMVTLLPSTVGAASASLVVLAVSVWELFFAAVDSWRMTVTVSPTLRGGGVKCGSGSGWSSAGRWVAQAASSRQARASHEVPSARAGSAGRAPCRQARLVARFCGKDSGVLGGILQHLVDGRDRLGVHLVGALGLDHVDELLDHVDVGALELALAEGAEAVGPGRAGLRRAARGRLHQQVLADGSESRRVDEVGELQLSHLGRRGLTGEQYAHRAVAADRDALRPLRNGDPGLHLVAARGDDLSLGVGLEGTVAGVGEGSIRHLDLEEPLPLDRQIERVA